MSRRAVRTAYISLSHLRLAVLLASFLSGFTLAPRLRPLAAAEIAGWQEHASVRVWFPLSLRDWGQQVLARAAADVWPSPPSPGVVLSQPARPKDPPAGTGAPELAGSRGAAGESDAAAPGPAPLPGVAALDRPVPRPGGRSSRPVTVAVYHTHTSEMYRTATFQPADPLAYHRFDTEETGIVRVGAALVDALNRLGVGAVHVTAVHDYPNHNAAYARSLETARGLVERYPSLRLLVDLHRDAPQEGANLVTSVEGESVARIAIVIGLGSRAGEAAPNLRVADALAAELESRFPGLLRRVLTHTGRRYNQQVHPGAILIEIGSYQTREEAAIRSAYLLAQAVAGLLGSASVANRTL